MSESESSYMTILGESQQPARLERVLVCAQAEDEEGEGEAVEVNTAG